MTSPIEQLHEDKIIIQNDVIFIQTFTENNPSVVSYVKDAKDASDAVRQLLHIGAATMQTINSNAETQNIQIRFESLNETFNNTVSEAIETLGSIINGASDDITGSIPATLNKHTEQLSELLGDTFDPQSKASALEAFRTIMTDAFEKQSTNVRQIISIDDQDSPLNKLKRELNHNVDTSINLLRKDVQQLSEGIAVNKVTNDMRKKTAAKGFDFEEIVHDQLSALAALHGDTAEPVGSITGNESNKKGDELIHINREDTNGHKTQFICEMKARKLSLRAINDELDQAMINRNAPAAIAIFDSQKNAPTSVPFTYTDNKAIVVFDENDEHNPGIELAYMWARWVVRRHLNMRSELNLNPQRIETLIQEAQNSLEKVNSIRTGHAQAKKGIESASKHLNQMSQDITDSLEVLKNELLHKPNNKEI